MRHPVSTPRGFEQPPGVLVVGGGMMGGDIAASFAAAGARVQVMSPSQRTRRALPGRLRGAVAALKADAARAEGVALHESLEGVPWSEVGLVVESVSEDLELKRGVFLDIERRCRPGTVLTTNTSTLKIEAIAEPLAEETRKRTAGLHYFMPAHLVPLVEIVRSRWTHAAVCEDLERWTRAARKAPVHVEKDIPGFIGNRLQAALLREALYLVESGVASAEGIDTAVRFGFGFRFMACGPMKQREFAGWDGHLRSGNTLYAELCSDKRHGRMLHEMVREGRLGVKTKEGFWKYTDEQIAAEKAAYDAKLRAALELLEADPKS